MLGEDRAIVTDIAGTTRDILQENISLQGISLNIMDTAGIRDTADIIEEIGVQKAIRHAKEADLIIYVIDSSAPLDQNDYDILKLLKDKKSIILLNKSDLEMQVKKKEIMDAYLGENKEENKFDIPMIEISAIENTLKDMFYHGDISFNSEVYITNVRHKTALQNALQSLNNVIQSIDMQMPEDFYSIDLMDAYETLGSITGETIGEDLVNEIFSKFCMGK